MVGDGGTGHETSHGYHGVRPVPRHYYQQQVHQEPQHERRPVSDRVSSEKWSLYIPATRPNVMRLPQEYGAVISRGPVLTAPGEPFLAQAEVFGHGQYGKR